MPACSHKTKDGTCRGSAKLGSKYCQLHLNRMKKQVKHGRYAKDDTLGIPVPVRYMPVYQDYVNSDAPYDLRKQFGMLNALLYEMREVMDQRAAGRITALLDGVATDLRSWLFNQPKEKVDALVSRVQSIVTEQVREHIPFSGRLTPDDLTQLGDELERVSRFAEKMKKINEGVELKVHLDFDTILRFLQQVILPILPTPQQRALAVQKTRDFAQGRYNPQEVVILDGYVQPADVPEQHASGVGADSPSPPVEESEPPNPFLSLYAPPVSDDWDDPHADDP